jgi:hypothetical protein
MNKCMTCSGTLRKEETTCFICGTPVPVVHVKKPLRERFRLGVKIAFFFSAFLTVASIFVGNYTPSFTKCLVATLILMLVKSSADQMSESQ